MLVAVFLGFTKDIPFTHGFRVHAVFESANSLRVNSPVRIAGVNVGKVKSVTAQEGTNQSLVTMEIKDNGLPIHEDATAKIRPRIFLEGNFFVDLKPGAPSSPKLEDGDTIKVTRTATPVQLDQVLTSLQSDTRQDLRDLLDALAQGLNSEPTAADDADADPSARGETAAESFNDAYKDSPAALRGGAQVNQALLGTEPARDVSRLLEGTAKTTGALIRNEGQLQDLITNFNTTMAAFASESGNLSASIRLLAPTLANANAAFASLNRAFPPTRAFARDILPGVNETAATIDASFPWVDQMRKLFSQSELRGLAEDLAPTARDLAKVTNASLQLFPQVDRTSLCARDVILPTGDIVVHDELRPPAPRTTRSSGGRWSASRARARTSTATAPTSASRPAAARTPSRSAPPARPPDSSWAPPPRRSSASGRSTPASARRTTRACPATRARSPTSTGRGARGGQGEGTP